MAHCPGQRAWEGKGCGGAGPGRGLATTHQGQQPTLPSLRPAPGSAALTSAEGPRGQGLVQPRASPEMPRSPLPGQPWSVSSVVLRQGGHLMPCQGLSRGRAEARGRPCLSIQVATREAGPQGSSEAGPPVAELQAGQRPPPPSALRDVLLSDVEPRKWLQLLTGK